jgi:hypothetical protein
MIHGTRPSPYFGRIRFWSLVCRSAAHAATGISRASVAVIVRGRVDLDRPAGRHVRPSGPHCGEVIVGRVVLLGEHHDVIHYLGHSPTLASGPGASEQRSGNNESIHEDSIIRLRCAARESLVRQFPCQAGPVHMG